MDIGEPVRIHEIKPLTIPVPQWIPAQEPHSVPTAVPAETPETVPATTGE